MTTSNKIIFVVMVLFIFVIPVLAQEKTNDFPVLKGPYLGQKPPGMTPEIFAPGIISTGMAERDVAITPDGKEFYYSIYFNGCHFIMTTRQENGRWTPPEVAPFSGRYSDNEPFIHPDGSKFFFVSRRPLDTNSGISKNMNIWFMEKDGDRWSKPRPIGSPINNDRDVMFPSVTKTGTMYFTGRTEKGGEAIYRSKLIDGRYAEPEKLPEKINATHQQGNAMISPDESFLIVCTGGREDAVGGWDYYITFRSGDDEWSDLINLGNVINTENDEYSPALSPDGKYFFFQSQSKSIRYFDKPLKYSNIKDMFNKPGYGSTDIYWVDAEIIRNLRTEE